MRRQFILGIEEMVNSQKTFELEEDEIVEILLELAPKRVPGIMMMRAATIKEKGV